MKKEWRKKDKKEIKSSINASILNVISYLCRLYYTLYFASFISVVHNYFIKCIM